MYCRAPLRVSFCGGGTDLLAFAANYGGYVVSAAIDQYVRVSNATVQIPLEGNSGLGTSGAIAVAKIKLAFPNISNDKLFKAAVQIEGLGQQDQAMAICGGFQFLEFGDCEYKATSLMPLENTPFENFEKRLALVYLGKRTKSAEDILQDEIKLIKSKANYSALMQSKTLAHSAARAVIQGDVDYFIDIIKEAWQVKKHHSPDICTPNVQAAEEFYMEQKGVQAFKLCGAGNGGYALIIKKADLDIGMPLKFANQGAKLERR